MYSKVEILKRKRAEEFMRKNLKSDNNRENFIPGVVGISFSYTCT